MSTTTSNFGLFKYDVVEDAQSAFSIQQALNYNWDIIDENLGSSTIATYETPGIIKPDGTSIYVDENGLLSMGNHGFITSSYHSGASWYRQYSDGFKMAGGKVATSASDIAWSQPNLSSDGTLGGNSFAIHISSVTTASPVNKAYYAFDGNTSTAWSSAPSAALPYYITMYNPTAIKISQFTMINRTGFTQAITGYNINASNSNSNYTTLYSGSNSVTASGATWYIPVNSSNYYKYYQIEITAKVGYAQLAECKITATYLGSGGTGITFPISFSDTNYSCMLGFQGGSGSSTYISTKSTTGMTLSSTPSATCYWIAMGW